MSIWSYKGIKADATHLRKHSDPQLCF